MKALLITLLCLLLGVGLFFFIQYSSEPVVYSPAVVSPQVSAPLHITQSIKNTLLFVPYWSLPKSMLSGYDRYVYFGITADLKGIEKTDAGYKGIAAFRAAVPTGEKLLAVRLLDADTNNMLLTNPEFASFVENQVVTVAKDNGFSGVVFDFEYSALAFDSVVQNISTLSSGFASLSHGKNMSFYQMIYGDTFYRVRPYDVSFLGKKTDGLFIMAYDFHKASGDPGPNFPMHDNGHQGYDIKTMAEDFLRKIDSSKLVVIFGMYGYDWPVNSKEQSIAQGQAISLVDIQKKFISSCQFTACLHKRDTTTGESHISYTDESGINHSLWYEDMNSVSAKEQLLHQFGINQTGFWAYSYF